MTSPQLNASAFASCLSLRGVTHRALPNLPAIRTHYQLSVADGLLLYLALYAGDRRAGLNATQQRAFERWSTPYEPYEAALADHLRRATLSTDDRQITPDTLFGVADSACGHGGDNTTSSLCGAIVAHNVLRALGRSYNYTDSHGVDYLPAWYKADRHVWGQVTARMEQKMISLQVDGGGCGNESNASVLQCWGEWYHVMGVFAFGIHEAALLGRRVGELASWTAAALNAIYVAVLGGHEDPRKARIDRDAAVVAAAFVDDGVLPGFVSKLCATRKGYVNGA